MGAVEFTEVAPSVSDASLTQSQPRHFTRDSSLRRLLASGDAFAVLVTILAVEFSRPAIGADIRRSIWGLFAIPLMLLLLKLYGLYDRDAKRISHSTVDDLPWLFHATVIGALLLWLYSRYSPMRRLDFVQILLFGIGTLACVSSVRFAIRTFAGALVGRERALLVGGGAMSYTLVRKLAAHPEYGLEVIGSLGESPNEEWPRHGQLPLLGTLEELDQVAADHDVGRVLFSAGDVDESDLELLLRRCRELSLRVSLLPGLSDVLGPGVAIDDVEGVTVLGINPPWLPRSSRALKRTLDCVVAGVVLFALLPVIAILVIAVKLDSPGPAFFAQIRVGRDGRRFRLYKFRTMVIDAEQRHAELLAQSSDPGWLKLDRDPRLTRLGRHLRRLSLDELPQLWNVLRGEMSLVGPRPLIEMEDERIEGWARGRLNLTPGITGYWQVLGRTRIPFEEMVKLDYLYVMNWSLWEDIRLILRTFPAVVGGRGAN